MSDIKECRCTKCNKLLGKLDGNYQIKCPRCGEMNQSYKEYKLYDMPTSFMKTE